MDWSGLAEDRFSTSGNIPGIGPVSCFRVRGSCHDSGTWRHSTICDIASNTEEAFDPAIDQALGTDAPVRDNSNQHIRLEHTPPPVVETPRRSITPNNRSLAVLESGHLVATQCHVPLARGAVSGSSIASLELQEFVELLPLDQLICHTPVAIQAWPTAAREEVLAVAHRDLAVARRNVADSTHYLDLHAAHLSACAVPSMTLFR